MKCAVAAEIFPFCTNLFPSPWLALQAIFSFLCVVNPHSLTFLPELSHFGGNVKLCYNAVPILPFSQRGSRSAPTLHTDPWGSGTSLVKSFPALLECDPVQTMQKPPEIFWQWLTIPRAAWNSSDLSAGAFIISPAGSGITKSMFDISKPFCLLRAGVERGWPARGQGLKPLLPYICVYIFHNASFGTTLDCVCSSPKPTLVISSHSSPAHVIWGFVNCKLCGPKLGFPGR